MSIKILVVDDEPDLEHLIRQKFRKKIREKEFEFVFAHNGVEALEQLKNNDSIELVLTDINMPQMDGLTLLTKMNELNKPLLRSVIVSAYGDMENIRTAMNRGAFDFVTKPIDLRDLEITISRSLDHLKQLKKALSSQEQLISIQQELDIATKIQTSILPKSVPEREEFKIFAAMNPAKEVGGDLYDFFLIDKNRLGFIIGDVSGKGVPAAMLMAVSKTLLKATALKGIPPDNCLETVNNLLVEDSLSHMFVTVFYGILDTRNGALEYCNGGHNPPFLISDGKVNALKHTGGLVVGAIKNTEYESNLISLQPGDTLFLYTDGVTEAENKERDEYQEQRLEDALVEVRSAEIDEIVEHILAEVNTFSEGMQQSDDITCLAVKYLGR